VTDTEPERQARIRFIFLLGWVSLFADVCYQGMRGALGPYLALLGASATAVGVVAGTGEAVGYALRYASGSFADRTRRYWTLAIIGYSTNLIAVPLLALAGSWPMVAVLLGVERLGKAIRSPAKATIVSFAASDLGAGRVFAITDAMDRIGGLLGPLVVAAVLAWRGDSREGFAYAFVILAIPAALSLVILLRARRAVPDPRALDRSTATDTGAFGARYRVYLVGVALIAIGLADWPLLAFHMEREGVLSTSWLPVAYAAAMAADAIVMLLAGRAFDRIRKRGASGASVVSICVIVGAGYAPLVLLADANTPEIAIAGIALWAVALAATESIGKAMIATLVPSHRRGRAYGFYYLVWGLAWWAGSVLLGALYDHDRTIAAVVAVVALETGAIVVALSSRVARTQ
jgi:MFS family permease